MRIRPASNRGVRVIEPHVGRHADTNLGVRVEWSARSATKAAAERNKRVAGNDVMYVPCPCHGIHETAQVLMLDRRYQLSGEVIFDGHEVELLGRAHAVKSTATESTGQAIATQS